MVDILATICESLDSGKGEDIVVISLDGSLADYFVIVGGTSGRHVSSLADRILEGVRDLHGVFGVVEGGDSSDWVLVDFGDVVVHLFRGEARGFYDLERLWEKQ